MYVHASAKFVTLFKLSSLGVFGFVCSTLAGWKTNFSYAMKFPSNSYASPSHSQGKADKSISF